MKQAVRTTSIKSNKFTCLRLTPILCKFQAAERRPQQTEELYGERCVHVVWGAEGLGEQGFLPRPHADSPGETGRDSYLQPCGETPAGLPERTGATAEAMEKKCKLGYDNYEDAPCPYFETEGEVCYLTRFITFHEYFEGYYEKHYVSQKSEMEKYFRRAREDLRPLVSQVGRLRVDWEEEVRSI